MSMAPASGLFLRLTFTLKFCAVDTRRRKWSFSLTIPALAAAFVPAFALPSPLPFKARCSLAATAIWAVACSPP